MRRATALVVFATTIALLFTSACGGGNHSKAGDTPTGVSSSQLSLDDSQKLREQEARQMEGREAEFKKVLKKIPSRDARLRQVVNQACARPNDRYTIDLYNDNWYINWPLDLRGAMTLQCPYVLAG